MPDSPDEHFEPIPVEPVDANEQPMEPVPVEPPPVEPIPVEALPVEALPVEALPDEPPPFVPPPPRRYDGLARLGPPRLVAAMGVWSIVVASLCLLGGAISTLTMMAISGTVMARTTAVAMTAVAPPVVSVPEVTDPDGFAAADRAAILDGLSRSHLLTPAQQLQLDELLAESGRDVVKLGSPIDPAVVAASVTNSGQLGTLGTAGAEVENPPIFFALSEGRLELTDTRAVFFPADGQPAIRAVAYVLPAPPSDPAAAQPLLTDDAIRSTMRNITRKNGGRLKGPHIQALLTLLRGGNQQVVVPMTDGGDPAAEITSATTEDDGTLAIETSHGGSICSVTVSSAGAVSATLTAGGTTPAGPPPGSGPLAAVLTMAAAEAAVAIYLLIVGILTVRQSRFGRLLHWIYVGVKLPVAIGAAVYLGRSVSNGSMAGWWAAPAALGAIYPVALIFVLCRRSVRDYYGLGITSA